MTVRLEPFGDGALRAHLPAGANRRRVWEALRRLPGVIDVVVTERHAVFTFDAGAPPPEAAGAIDAASSESLPPAPSREHVISVRYGPPDLEDVARAAGLSAHDVIALHVGATYRVAFVGFLPGFAYLRGLDPRLTVPRRSTPRARVAPLSVGLAGPYTGVYPFASPGGWSLIGQAVGFVPFDAASGAALALGDRVRFVEASA